MDESGIEARGTAPLKPYLDQIAAVKTAAELVDLFAEPGLRIARSTLASSRPDDPTRYVGLCGQGGLGMPNRDYYLLQGRQI